ncbi:MAG: tyrosine--tRNA ligase, partial [Ottowia sp.]|nr:tyrosine--tRNA ligase [Ottowia sp.]
DGVDKMSKSKGNYIGITEDANSMFAKTLSISDELMWRWYTLLSMRPMAEIEDFKRQVAEGRNPKDIKVLLAREITTRYHSAAAADAAEHDFALRSKGGVPDAIPEVHVKCENQGLGIGLVLKQARLAPSTKEANRLIAGGGVRLNSETVSDRALILAPGSYVLQVGKRRFARVTLKA